MLLRDEHFEAWRALTGVWVRRIQRIDGDGRVDGWVRDTAFEVVDPSCIPRL